MIKKIGIGLAYFAPLVVFAQLAQDIPSFLDQLLSLINLIVPFLIALIFLFFVFGVVKYIVSADNEESRKSSRDIMIWSIIAVFVVVSFWGLVAILTGTFGFEQVEQIDIPAPDVGGT